MSSFWRHIKKYWEHVTPADRAAGAAAYPAYHEMMRRIAQHYNVDQTRATEAFAALSPNSDYFGNLRSLVSLLQGMHEGCEFTVSTYKACAERAVTYITGEADFLSTVKGKKITAFRNCIVDPVGCDQFVLDGHMIAVALGQPMTMTEAQLAMRKVGYENIEQAYVRFAKRLSVRVPELQATLWFCRKRHESVKFTTQRDFWYDDARLLYPVADIKPYRNLGKPRVYNTTVGRRVANITLHNRLLHATQHQTTAPQPTE